MEFTSAWDRNDEEPTGGRHGADEAVGGELSAEFERSFANLRERLIRLVASLIGPSDAEDVVQDAYLAARGRLGQLRDNSALEAWLYRITVNTAYTRKRRQRMEARILPHVAVRSVVQSERDVALLELIDELAPGERALVVLHYGYGYRLAEIGQMLGLTEGAVKGRLFRVRRTLLRQLVEASDA